MQSERLDLTIGKHILTWEAEDIWHRNDLFLQKFKIWLVLGSLFKSMQKFNYRSTPWEKWIAKIVEKFVNSLIVKAFAQIFPSRLDSHRAFRCHWF
jgi:hypothetical protein